VAEEIDCAMAILGEQKVRSRFGQTVISAF
jgi:hypothetical protein